MFIFSSFILLALSDAIMQCKRPARWKLHDSIGAIREESEMTENLAVYELARPVTAERFSVADGKPLVRVEPAIFFFLKASQQFFVRGSEREGFWHARDHVCGCVIVKAGTVDVEPPAALSCRRAR